MADEARRSTLTRDALVVAALDLVQEDGIDALAMRPLADRLHVKPASLYWHLRDRDELLQLVAVALLAEVRPRSAQRSWRADAVAVCSALEQLTERRRDAARVLLEAPDAIERSEALARLMHVLSKGGLSAPEAAATARMMFAAVLLDALRRPDESPPPGRPVTVAIDTGSRGVTLRAGTAMDTLIRAAQDPSAPAPAVIRGDRVIVRRLRGSRQGELELNPGWAWRFQVQAPTWNTVLDLARLDVREVKVDSGAVRVECLLPPPRSVVPIDISSGVIGVRLRRTPGVPVVAEIGPGSVQLRLDGRPIAATGRDTRWETAPDASSGPHYRLRINSGTVRVSLEEDPSISAEMGLSDEPSKGIGARAALEVALDGIVSRSRRPREPSSRQQSQPPTVVTVARHRDHPQ